MKIFLFHRINNFNNPLWPAIHPDLFYKQISYLNNNFQIVNLEEYLKKEIKNPLHKKVASIVFDDGYRDIQEHALPVLKEFNIKASVYVVTDTIDSKTLIWTYLFDYLFIQTQQKGVNISFGSKLMEYRWKNDLEKFKVARNLKVNLKKTRRETRYQIIHRIKDQFNDVLLPDSPYLTWQELRNLKDHGLVIGSHSASHELLDQISDENQLKYELDHSAKRIIAELGDFPETISYPNGNYNATVMKIAKQTGYKYGLAVKQKTFNPDIDDLFEIPRIEFHNEPLWKTKLRINGTVTILKSLLGV